MSDFDELRRLAEGVIAEENEPEYKVVAGPIFKKYFKAVHPDNILKLIDQLEEAYRFAFGSPEWPGLSKLAEECGEVLQVIGKLMGTRGKVEHWDGTNLRDRLTDELADLSAAIQFVKYHCKLDNGEMMIRTKKKLERFERWHELGDMYLPDQPEEKSK